MSPRLGLIARRWCWSSAAAAAPAVLRTPRRWRNRSPGTGCSEFPADNWWHADVRRLPVHAAERQWLSHMSTGSDLHPDFGPSYGDGPDYGIPITVVGTTTAKVPVRFDYADESDRVRTRSAATPGSRAAAAPTATGTRSSSTAARAGSTRPLRPGVRDGRWYAGSGAVWSLRSNILRPDGWTSADAAGLPILPGLLRWNEVRDAGSTTPSGSPPTSPAGTTCGRPGTTPARRTSLAYPPMGARFRLKAASDGRLPPTRASVIRGDEAYGLVLADNGSPWFFQGEQNALADRLIEDLKTHPGVGLRGRRHLAAEGRRRQRPGAVIPIPGWAGGCGNVHAAVHGRLRAVAQLGSALDWGSRGRRFKSCQPDRETGSDQR